MAFSNGSSSTRFTAVLCSLLLLFVNMPIAVQAQTQQGAAVDDQAAKIPNDQLDSLVAPIAL